MPEMEINSAGILAELNKINAGVKALQSSVEASNGANKASYDMLKSGLAGVTAETVKHTATKAGDTAAVNLHTVSVNMNRAAVAQSTAGLMMHNAQILMATANLRQYKAAWDAVTMSINANSSALMLNSVGVLQNMAAVMQHTATTIAATLAKDLNNASIATNTAALLANSIGIDANSVSTALNTAIRTADSESLALHVQNLEADSDALLSNTGYTALSAIANALNGLSLYLVNSQLEKQVQNLGKSTEALRNNSKEMLINILANLGNIIATWLMNKQGSKNIKTVQAQTVAQNAYNGALAAAAILTNPIVGAATVAGAALAQGLMSGQKVELVSIEMGANETSTSREVTLAETLTSGSGGSLLGESSILTDIEKQSSGSVDIKGFAQLVPKMATGGIVTRPTMALIGEGKYDEAVLPLGNSPQMRNLKDDIANAVIQGLFAVKQTGSGQGKTSAEEIVLSIDGQKLARILLPRLLSEQKKHSNIKVV